MSLNEIKKRLISLEAQYPEKAFTLYFYRMPSGAEESARTPEEKEALEAKGGKMKGFDIHIPDKGGYHHLIWEYPEAFEQEQKGKA